jgi:uncharacterized membrane protein
VTALAPEAPARGSAPAGTSPHRRRGRRRLAVVTVLSIGIAVSAAGPYLLLDPATAEGTVGLREGAPIHFPVLVVHAATAGLALLIGPWQFVRRVRKHRRLHRYLGRAYLLAVVPASLSGLVAAVLTTAGPVAGLGFGLLDVAWVTTAAAGYLAAREHRYADHRRWMIRNFALTFAGVMLRVWVAVLVMAGLPFDSAYALVPWLSWIPNLAVVEWSLRRSARLGERHLRRRADR